MHWFFLIQSLQLLIFCMSDQEFLDNLEKLFYFSPCNTSKLIFFVLFCYIIRPSKSFQSIGRLNFKKHWTLNKKTHVTLLDDILHLAYCKFTPLLFRSNYSCLFSHFNDVALPITKLQNYWCIAVVVALWTAQAKLVPSASMLRKVVWGQV